MYVSCVYHIAIQQFTQPATPFIYTFRPTISDDPLPTWLIIHFFHSKYQHEEELRYNKNFFHDQQLSLSLGIISFVFLFLAFFNIYNKLRSEHLEYAIARF